MASNAIESSIHQAELSALFFLRPLSFFFAKRRAVVGYDRWRGSDGTDIKKHSYIQNRHLVHRPFQRLPSINCILNHWLVREQPSLLPTTAFWFVVIQLPIVVSTNIHQSTPTKPETTSCPQVSLCLNRDQKPDTTLLQSHHSCHPSIHQASKQVFPSISIQGTKP